MPTSKKNSQETPVSIPAHVEEELILTRYAQTKNLSRTAKEFNTNPMRVKRMWERLSEDAKQGYIDAAEEGKEELRETINQSDIQFTKEYALKMKESLNRATQELYDRLSPERVKGMSDKELINAVRLLNNICIGGDDDDSPNSSNTIFALMDMSLNENMTIKTKPDDDGEQ